MPGTLEFSESGIAPLIPILMVCFMIMSDILLECSHLFFPTSHFSVLWARVTSLSPNAYGAVGAFS
uniref:Uncharacterized protein n=1 Tax=Arundo donax TaxID=35708 RepID=A0A0A9H4R5_ARUDO